MTKVIVVKAIHAYNPTNNDELQISPGDIITLTNSEEESWWEGTLGSRTGWFPSNYVCVIEPLQPLELPKPELSEYKHTIIRELIDSEIAYIREMEEFENHVIKLISNTLHDNVISHISQSYGNLISVHKNSILQPIQSAGGRVGKIFLNSDIVNAHTSYCTNHPKYVSFVERNQESLSGIFGDSTGVLKIITALSCPFRRIERYGNILAELERYVNINDIDRGDIGRAVLHYRNLQKTLTSLRKQKEMELEVITSGAIRDYEGPDVNTLGDILLMDLVYVCSGNTNTREPRYFVLFTHTLLILSYDNVQNTLIYNGRVYVNGLVVSLSDDTRCFEISGPTIHSIIVQFDSPTTLTTWVSKLNDLVRFTRCHSTVVPPASTSTISQCVFPVNKPMINTLSPVVSAWNIGNLRPNSPYNPFLSQYRKQQTEATTRSSSSSNGFERSSFKFKASSSSSNLENTGVTNEDDLTLLSIVDSFCNANNRSSTVKLNNTRVRTNNVINPGVSTNNRSLPQLVTNLSENVNFLNDRINQLSKQLDEERIVKSQLIEIVNKLADNRN